MTTGHVHFRVPMGKVVTDVTIGNNPQNPIGRSARSSSGGSSFASARWTWRITRWTPLQVLHAVPLRRDAPDGGRGSPL
jgi:hypothetical protein